jgi:hypothetical protein
MAAVHHGVPVVDAVDVLARGHPEHLRVEKRQRRVRRQPSKLEAREDDAAVLEAAARAGLVGAHQRPDAVQVVQLAHAGDVRIA